MNSLVFSALLVSIFWMILSDSNVMAAEVNGVENELIENMVIDDQTLTAASCVSPELTYAKKDSGKKEITFIAKGTPGSSITLYIYKFTEELYGTIHSALDSTGYRVLPFNIANGSYEAVLKQNGSCSEATKPFFFTMN